MGTALGLAKVILQCLGSLVIFLYGMKVMSDGLQKAAGTRLQNTLNLMTKNRFVGVLTGAGITSLIQSSSATTVMVVSFANAGLITLQQSIGVIMGANIGTTITAWIVSIASVVGDFNIIHLSIMFLAFMLPLMFSKKAKFTNTAEAFIGLTLIFVGLEFIKDSIPPIDEISGIQDFLSSFSDGHFTWYHVLLFVLVGVLLTALLQSSSAVTAIAIALVVQGIFPFLPVAALVIGSNIGTTITAFLASLGAKTNAKRASMAHILFNVFGALWAIILFTPFVHFIEFSATPLVDLVCRGISETEPLYATKQATIQVSVFHTLFNLINTTLLIGFVPAFAKLVEKIVPQKEKTDKGKYELKYISVALQDTPEINLQNAKAELKKMTDVTLRMFNLFLDVFSNPDKKMGSVLERLKSKEDYTDQMQEAISCFLQECDRENLTPASHHNVNSMIRITHELENIGDSCYNLGILTQKKYEGEINFSEEALTQLAPFIEITKSFLDFLYNNMNTKISDSKLEEAIHLEDKIGEMQSKLTYNARIRIQKGGDVKAELLFLDLLKHLEHIGDSALNIAQELRALK